MATEIVPLGTFGQRSVEKVSGSYTSADNTLTVVSGSASDLRGYSLVSYMLWSTTNDMKVSIFVANSADFSDEHLLFTATAVPVASGVMRWCGSTALNTGTTTTSILFSYGFARLKAQPNVNDVHGTLNFTGIGKIV